MVSSSQFTEVALMKSLFASIVFNTKQFINSEREIAFSNYGTVFALNHLDPLCYVFNDCQSSLKNAKGVQLLPGFFPLYNH